MKQLLILTGVLLLLTACGKDEGPDNPIPETQESVIKEGMEMYSQIFTDGNLQEESVDKVVNFGRSDSPILFHVNLSHTYNGVPVPEGPTDMDCSFYSLTEKEYMDFIKLFARMLEISTTDQLTDAQKQEAFTQLATFLYESKIELALLIYLIDNDINELKAAYGMLQDASGTRWYNADLNSLLASMIRGGLKPTQLAMQLDLERISLGDFLQKADIAGVNVAQMIQSRVGVTSIIKAVVNGVVLFSKLVVAFVEHAKPVVNIENTYISYLHEEDLDPLNYYGARQINSQTYECRYGTKEVPMAQCIFHAEAYIGARHKKYQYAFIPRVGMLVERVRASAGMHVEGKVEYSPGMTTYSPEGPVAYGDHSIVIEYGDALCFARKARLSYTVHGTQGFEYVEWKSK